MKTLVISVIALAAAAATAAIAQDDKLPEGPNREVFVSKCSTCHSPGRVAYMHRTKAGWADTVEMMKEKGAELTPAETEQIVAYLTANFGPEGEAPAPPAVTPAATNPPAPATP